MKGIIYLILVLCFAMFGVGSSIVSAYISATGNYYFIGIICAFIALVGVGISSGLYCMECRKK